MTEKAFIASHRFGYGPGPSGPLDPDRLLGSLTGPDRAAVLWPGVTGRAAYDLMVDYREARIALRAEDSQTHVDGFKSARQALRALEVQGNRAAFARAVGGEGFRERLAFFWADHFTVIPRAASEWALPAALIEDAIRPHISGRFGDMLVAAVTHPAMLLYLDQAGSIGPNSKAGKRRDKGLNENLAREVLELHTLGVQSGYGQSDVRELAELFTGMSFGPVKGFIFDKNRVEPGKETVLGKAYAGKGMEPIHRVLQDLALRPETAAHVSRKLAVHFVSDTPEEDLVAVMAAAWGASQGDLLSVLGAMLAHPAAWRGEGKVKQPFDFVISSLRSMGLQGNRIYKMVPKNFQMRLVAPLAGMGQRWQRPSGPDGWSEAASAWVTPAGMAARIEWAMSVPAQMMKKLPDPREIARSSLGPRASERLLWAVGAAENRAIGLGLVFSSPEFNRR